MSVQDLVVCNFCVYSSVNKGSNSGNTPFFPWNFKNVQCFTCRRHLTYVFMIWNFGMIDQWDICMIITSFHSKND